MKSKKIVLAKPPRSRGADMLILVGGLLLLSMLIVLSIRFLPRRQHATDNAARVSALTNLGALSSDYSIDRGEDRSTSRSVWVLHKGASDLARVLVSVIEKDDPSGRKTSLYYAGHFGQHCKAAADAMLHADNQVVRVARTFCDIDGDTEVEEQAVFKISDFYSVSVYESAEKSQFDYPAFANVINAVLEAHPQGKNHLD